MGTHYAPSQEPDKLQAYAVAAATEIEVTLPGQHVILCYTGMSGISLATALMLELNRRKHPVGMIYVRKPDEQSHGGRIECNNVENGDAVLIFIDEQISSGATLKRVQTALRGMQISNSRFQSSVTPCPKEITYALLENRWDNGPILDKDIIERCGLPKEQPPKPEPLFDNDSVAIERAEQVRKIAKKETTVLPKKAKPDWWDEALVRAAKATPKKQLTLKKKGR